MMKRVCGAMAVGASFVVGLPNSVAADTGVFCEGQEVGAPFLGTSDPDVIQGGDEGNVMHGLASQDDVYASFGSDHSCGGDGSDNVHGGSGNDAVFGGDGCDRLEGYNGGDNLFGQGGDDTYPEWGGCANTGTGQGYNGYIFGGANADNLHGGDGNDYLLDPGGLGEGNNVFRGGEGWDRCDGVNGDNYFNCEVRL